MTGISQNEVFPAALLDRLRDSRRERISARIKMSGYSASRRKA